MSELCSNATDYRDSFRRSTKADLQCPSYNQLPESTSVHLPVSKESLRVKLARFEFGTRLNFRKELAAKL
jgi:hypothetical protein